MRSFHTYGVRGRSSSLAKHAHPEASFARDGPGAAAGAVGFVAELTLRQLLNAISPRIVVPMLKVWSWDGKVEGRGWGGVGRRGRGGGFFWGGGGGSLAVGWLGPSWQ